jgi:hypothetical protein
MLDPWLTGTGSHQGWCSRLGREHVEEATVTATTSDPAATDTEDRLEILELIGKLALLLDARDWSAFSR